MSWADWREDVAKACDGSHHTIESIEAEIAAGELMPLETTRAIYLVQIVPYPTEIACQIMWAAGDLDDVLEDLSWVNKWAVTKGCTEILVEGRLGWQRKLQNHGYRPWSVTMRRPLYGAVV